MSRVRELADIWQTHQAVQSEFEHARKIKPILSLHLTFVLWPCSFFWHHLLISDSMRAYHRNRILLLFVCQTERKGIYCTPDNFQIPKWRICKREKSSKKTIFSNTSPECSNFHITSASRAHIVFYWQEAPNSVGGRKLMKQMQATEAMEQ